MFVTSTVFAFCFFSTHFLANFHCCNIVTIMLIYLVNINKCNIVTVILIYLVNILCSHCRSMLFAFLASVCCSTVWVLLWTFYFVTSFWHLSNKCYNIHVSLCSVNLLYLCDSSTQIFTSAKEVMFFFGGEAVVMRKSWFKAPASSLGRRGEKPFFFRFSLPAGIA